MSVMIGMYCRAVHGTGRDPGTDASIGVSGSALCPDCAALLAYSSRRIERCPFGADKPSCASCLVHCYRPLRRDEIRVVMRYAGPRMLWRHPFLALMHVLDQRLHPPS